MNDETEMASTWKCRWFGHAWTKWRDIRTGQFQSEDEEENDDTYVEQRRDCVLCGEAELATRWA